MGIEHPNIDTSDLAAMKDEHSSYYVEPQLKHDVLAISETPSGLDNPDVAVTSSHMANSKVKR